MRQRVIDKVFQKLGNDACKRVTVPSEIKVSIKNGKITFSKKQK